MMYAARGGKPELLKLLLDSKAVDAEGEAVSEHAQTRTLARNACE